MISPAFQFYPKQWLADDNVLLMDLDAQALHLRCMCLAWQQDPPCTLPDDDGMLKKWCGNPEEWDRIKPQILRAWRKDGDRWVQDGLLRELTKQLDLREKRQAAAEKRWGKKAKRKQRSCKSNAKTMLRARAHSEEEIEVEELLSSLISEWNTRATSSGMRTVKPESLISPSSASEHKRRATATTRLEEHPDIAEWVTVIERVSARLWCRGENDSGWTADFEYLCRVNTFDDHFDGKHSTPERANQQSGRKIRRNAAGEKVDEFGYTDAEKGIS